MEKRHKKTLARTLGCGTACTKLILVTAIFVPALLAFTRLPDDGKSPKTTHILKVVEVIEKPRPKELVTVYSVIKSHRPDIADSEAWKVADVILGESTKRNLDPMLVLAVIQVESGFQYSMVSPMGARGIMQIMPDTGKFLAEIVAQEYGVKPTSFRPESLDDPVFNIKLGVYYLHDLKKQFPTLNLVLAAYNIGPGEIQNRLENNQKFSDVYADLVHDAYKRYSKGKPATF